MPRSSGWIPFAIRWSVTLSLLCSAGCASSLSADARMAADLDGASGEADADAETREQDRPLSKAELARAQSFAEGEAGAADGAPLFGARHDVRVKSTADATACRCVGALLGPPTMSQVEWQSGVPRTIPEKQLFLALAPESDCKGAPAGTEGASYWGYRVQGNDVVVFLESFRPSARKPAPPRTIAAIIPKPPAGGQVYLAPLTGGLPFGAALNGKEARCALGNPGPQGESPRSAEPATDDSDSVAD